MNAGVTSERVYGALKLRLLSGDIPPGERLEPKKLAAALASSVSPVRDALHRLAGEHIVEMRLAEGFQLPLVTEPGLRDLYRWNRELLSVALRRRPGRKIANVDAPAAKSAAEAEDPADYPARLRMLFGTIGERAGHGELGRQIEAASDRLAVARAAESRVVPGAADEIAGIAAAIARDDAHMIARHIATYHRHRASIVPAIVEAIYRGA